MGYASLTHPTSYPIGIDHPGDEIADVTMAGGAVATGIGLKGSGPFDCVAPREQADQG